MKAELLYKPYLKIDYANKLLAIPENAKWMIRDIKVSLVSIDLSNRSMTLNFSEEDGEQLPRIEDQKGDIERSLIAQLLKVKEWNEILTRSNAILVINHEKISATITVEDKDFEMQGEQYFKGFFELVNIVLILVIQNIFSSGVKLVKTQIY